MINGRLSNILEGCLEFLEFGRHGRALDFDENLDNRFPNISTDALESNYDQRRSKSNHRGKRTRSKLKPRTCNCEYAYFTYVIFLIWYQYFLKSLRIGYLGKLPSINFQVQW